MAAAIGAAVVAATPIAALAAGAAIDALGAFEIVAAVGAVTSVIGKFTGDKTLMQVGMVVGAIGGVGAIASGAGLLGDVASGAGSLFGSASSAATDTASDAASTVSDAGATAATNALGQLAPVETSVLPDITPAAAAAPDAAEGATQATGLMNSGANAAGTVANATGPATSAATAVNSPAANAVANAMEVPTGAASASAADDVPNSVNITSETAGTNPGGFVGASVTGANATSSDSFWNSDLIKFLQSSGGGKVATVGIQSIGGLLAGGFNPVTPAQAAELQSQAALNRQQAQLLRTQQINIAQPLPVASNAGTTVTGKPATTPISGAPTGLINTPSGLVPSAQPGAVTGAAV